MVLLLTIALHDFHNYPQHSCGQAVRVCVHWNFSFQSEQFKALVKFALLSCTTSHEDASVIDLHNGKQENDQNRNGREGFREKLRRFDL